MKNGWMGLALLLVLGCTSKPDNSDAVNLGIPLAVAAGDTITVEDFRYYLSQNQGQKVDISDPLQRQGMLNDLIHRKLIYRYGLESDLQKQAGVYLAARTKTDEFLYNRVLLQVVYPSLVSDSELRDYYEHLKHEVRLSQILLTHDRSRRLASDDISYRSQSEARRLGDSLYLVLQQKADLFGKLALEFSDDQNTKYLDGDLGFVRWGQTSEFVEKAAFSLSVGATSKPLVGPRGIHLFRVTEQRSISLRPFEEIRDELLSLAIETELRRRNPTFEQRRLEFVDSLFGQGNYKVDKTSIDLFLSRYRSVDHSHEILESFSDPEMQLELASYDGGNILVRDLANVVSDNQKKVELDRNAVLSGLKRAVEIRLMADFGRRLGYELNRAEKREVIEEQTDKMAELEFRRIYEAVQLTDEKIKSYYEGNIDKYRLPPNINVAAINTPDETVIVTYFGELQKGAEFNTVFEKARDDGKSSVAVSGFVPSDRPDEIVQHARSLRVGEYSQPYQSSQGGYSIVHLIGRTLGEIRPFDVVKQEVAHDATHFYRQVARDELFARLAEKYKVQRFDDNLKKAFEVKIK